MVGLAPYAGNGKAAKPHEVSYRIRSRGTTARLRRDFQVAEPEQGSLWFIGEADNFPAVGQDDLLHDGQAKSGPASLRGEIGFEDFGAILGGNARTVVAHFQYGF